MAFFLSGRPHGKLDGSMAHFRSLRSTRAYQRAKAVAFVEQVWELTYALEKRVQLPPSTCPGSRAARCTPTCHATRRARPARCAPTGAGHRPDRASGAPHGVARHRRGLPRHDPDAVTVDAFSTSSLPRPIVVLTPNRFDDIYRHRFTAAHELGHLVLHGDTAAGDPQQEREADAFAAEFLTPRDSILPQLPLRADLRRLAELRLTWGCRSTRCSTGAGRRGCSPTPPPAGPTSGSPRCATSRASPTSRSPAIRVSSRCCWRRRSSWPAGRAG
ncbi:ImmA/IrrE family metallo-endopeptidase [Nonomuraea rubra]|uniref:ImmA/IrrE family metallo-endopeptidase n=1 Tax=Nonomuraea rubra TaxID=46180 RepID=UPI003608D627